MSATPPDPKDAAKKEANNAILWALLAAALAAYMFVSAPGIEDEKKRTFYYVGGVIAGLVAAFHGYAAWVAHNKAKQPPKA
jgi:ammonia channel protein AmtB